MSIHQSKQQLLQAVKFEVHLGTGHEGPEGEQNYRTTLSLTSALGGGVWATPRPGRFTPGKDPVPIAQEAVASSGCFKKEENGNTHRDRRTANRYV